MLRKLIVLAITSGLAARLYRTYLEKQEKTARAAQPATVRRRRRAGAQTKQA
jgi:hypothetical protein